jgi:hypothetical protein
VVYPVRVDVRFSERFKGRCIFLCPLKAVCLKADFRERVLAPLRLVGIPEEASVNGAPQADAATPNSQH